MKMSLIQPVSSINLNHEFHKLNKNTNSGKNDKFSLLNTNICSLQGNFAKLKMLPNDFEYQFDMITLTETWHNHNNPSLRAGILPGYQGGKGDLSKYKI